MKPERTAITIQAGLVAVAIIGLAVVFLAGCSGVPVRSYASSEAEPIVNEAFDSYLY